MMFSEFLSEAWIKAARELLAGELCQGNCGNPAEVHVLATRGDGEMRELIVCKEHLLDPGPLLDW